LPFPVLSDAGNAYAAQLGLAFTLPDDLPPIYSAFGVDLPALHGEESWRLPVPARLVVARDGTIKSIDADPDYTVRPEPEATLAVLRSLS
jgi:peroxiredoxin